ncbi:MAG: L,D-transpeptidase family protein [Phycisphaerales bacterium]
MVLSSQTPRAGMSRMYMSSKPRSGAKWGWLLLIGVGLISMWTFVWSDSDANQATGDAAGAGLPASARADSRGVDPSLPATEQPTGRPASVNDLPPPRDLATASANNVRPEPVVQTIRLGETPNSTPPAPVSAAAGTPAANPGPSGAPSSALAGSQLARGMNMIREGRLVQGRRELSQLLFSDRGNLSALDAQTVRDTLSSVNKQLVFSDQVTPGDTLSETYVVQRGDYLSRIAPKYAVPYQFIERINNTPAERLQAGKPIKLVKGPFHARISKSDFRMDIYVNDADGQPIYIRSFTVGLGKDDSTPMGPFIVAPNSKVQNPSWKNPRTGEFYGKDDPKNPIGEYWLALKGTDAVTEAHSGYGIHGTIDPQSIGRQASMGCVRLSDDDIALVYDMLESGRSTVQITW